MSGVPIRSTLHDQLVASIRSGIENARWIGEMPSEAELCREFQVSRMTLRKALAQLADEKWIALGGRGSCHRVLRSPKRKPVVSTAKTIRVLTPFGFAGWSTTDYVMLETLSERVSAAGYRVEIEHHRGVYENFQPSKLARLNALPDTAAWLLFYATEPIQRWFAASGRTAVMVGRLHEGVELSSIYPDNAAVGRHVAGMLHAHGHRELVYLIENLTSLGDRISSEVFVSELTRLGARARIVAYDAVSMSRVVMNLMASRPRPTAYVCGAPGTAINVLCHLQAAGIKVPAEAAVVSMWEDVNLDVTFPTIARYQTDGKLVGRKIGATFMNLLRHGTGKARAERIEPTFVAGGSVGMIGR